MENGVNADFQGIQAGTSNSGANNRLEKAERIHDKTGVSFKDAREALEACGYDELDAIVWLEERGRTEQKSANYSTAETAADGAKEMSEAQSDYEKSTKTPNYAKGFERIGKALKKFAKRLVEIKFVAMRNGRQLFSAPLLLVLVIALFAWWIVIPAIIISLFFGISYRFDGVGTVTIDVNKMSEKASDGIENLKKDVMSND